MMGRKEEQSDLPNALVKLESSDCDFFPFAHVPKEAGQEAEGDTEWSPEGDGARGHS